MPIASGAALGSRAAYSQNEWIEKAGEIPREAKRAYIMRCIVRRMAVGVCECVCARKIPEVFLVQREAW